MPAVAMVCSICEADVPDDQVVDYRDGRAHLIDSGPARHELTVHPVHRAASVGRTYNPPAPALQAPHPPAGLGPLLRLAAAVAGWTLWVDASKWQGRPFDGSYPWDFAMYRLTLSTTVIDELGSANGAYCHAHSGPGQQLAAHGGYHVWYPGSEDQQAAAFFRQALLDDRFVGMIDVERWGGAISGDHSAQLNRLADLFAAKLGRQRTIAYGNLPDLAELWPNRPAWLRLVKARYSSQPPAAPWLGWQFSDGSTTWPVPAGWPHASAPFGPADHNAYQGTTADLLTAFGITGRTGMDDAALTKLITDAARAAATLVHQDEAGTHDRVVKVLAGVVDLAQDMTTVLKDVETLPARLQQALGQQAGGTLDVRAVAAQVAPLLQINAAGTARASTTRLLESAQDLLADLHGQAAGSAAAAADPAGGAE